MVSSKGVYVAILDSFPSAQKPWDIASPLYLYLEYS